MAFQALAQGDIRDKPERQLLLNFHENLLWAFFLA